MLAVERRRIQDHLLAAERGARSRDLSGLSAVQLTARALLLEELAIYRDEGVFPRNPDFDVPMPYFIDAAGTRCAIAHLMEIGGAADLVAEIASTRNNAYVEELADDPRVLAWLDAAGLLPEEAARIQPRYCRTTIAKCVCDIDRPLAATAVARGTVTAIDGGAWQSSMRISDLAGASSGPCADARVGDELVVGYGYGDGRSSSSEVTVTLGPATAPEGGTMCAARPIFASANGVAVCSDPWFEYRLPANLTAADTLSAVMADDCQAHLEAKDPAWTAVDDCGDDGGLDEGCNVGTSGVLDVVSSAFVLAAVVAYRAHRRRAS